MRSSLPSIFEVLLLRWLIVQTAFYLCVYLSFITEAFLDSSNGFLGAASV